MRPKKYTLKNLFNRMAKGVATKEEKQTAQQWYSRLDLTGGEAFGSAEEELRIQERMRLNLHAHVHQNKILKLYRSLSVQKIAAVLSFALLTLAIGGYLLKNHPIQQYQVASGNQHIRAVTLPDGTRVMLNMGSSISWKSNYNTLNRAVHLVGEAYFDVKKDKQRPFIVSSANINTIVLGTAFTVEAYPTENHLNVSLIRGKVKIEDQDNQDNKVFLLPGNMASYDTGTGKIEVRATAVEAPDAWTHGALVFNDIPLATAIERLSTKYHLNIQFDKTEMEKKKVTASFHVVSWQEALHSILFANNMTYIIKDNTIHIINN
ncbi:FecR family protein [Pedobacter hiemivivus]|uniref:DUF4974 domain-containing protein n=1 Tax=Pedobacter hiemivivus TaxID=2530454 RepID=A0A4R0NKH3_9SPHI|nr:FecR family protein [Pedobacter hiemivivus]TCC99454.1 DUF4974 domain-containing protein [Pedobacter hiemivivus]